VETGEGEAERGEETVEAGVESGATGEDVGEAPCTEPNRGEPLSIGEDGVDVEASSARGGGAGVPSGPSA
jgi:hypothetical protein